MSLMDSFIAWKQRREYQANIEKNKISSVINHLISDTFNKSTERVRHPFHDIRLEAFKLEVSKWKKNEVNVNFGDSLTDLSRKQVERVHDGVFSISGSWANHIEMMAVDMKESLSKFKVKNISIGCLGGNPMLAYQNYEEVLADSLHCLNKTRELYPDARIIVYGLPPVFAIYVTENTYLFDAELQKWCNDDKDAKFISLKKEFGTGFNRLFPSFRWSFDGIHFNPRGAANFAELIKVQMK
jgi:hypothetical protein